MAVGAELPGPTGSNALWPGAFRSAGRHSPRPPKSAASSHADPVVCAGSWGPLARGRPRPPARRDGIGLGAVTLAGSTKERQFDGLGCKVEYVASIVAFASGLLRRSRDEPNEEGPPPGRSDGDGVAR